MQFSVCEKKAPAKSWKIVEHRPCSSCQKNILKPQNCTKSAQKLAKTSILIEILTKIALNLSFLLLKIRNFQENFCSKSRQNFLLSFFHLLRDETNRKYHNVSHGPLGFGKHFEAPFLSNINNEYSNHKILYRFHAWENNGTKYYIPLLYKLGIFFIPWSKTLWPVILYVG